MGPLKAALIWLALALAIAVPLVIAASSPLLAWREPIYIIAGFTGVIALALLLLQPLLVGGYLPGLTGGRGRRVHRIMGFGLVLSVIVHVGGLWITSPPDVVDALLFVSPTPFSAWGVIATWGVFAAALLAVMRQRLHPRVWRVWHTVIVVAVVGTTVVHAVLIDGTMGTVSKVALCTLAVAATVKAVADRRAWKALSRAPTRRRDTPPPPPPPT